MNLIFMSLIMILNAPVSTVADGDRWKPFDHPATTERSFTAYTHPGGMLVLLSGAMGFFRVENVLFSEGDRIPGRDGEWVPAIQVDAALDKAQKRTIEIRLELAKSATERARLASVRADSAARLAQKELDRVSALLEKGDASKRVYDQALQRSEEMTAVADSARVALTDSLLSVRLVESELQTIEEKIDQSTLFAPAGWYVESSLVVEGSGLTLGQRMMTLVDRSHFKLIIPMSEEEIRALSESTLKLQRVLGGAILKPSEIHVRSVPDVVTHRRKVTITIPAEEFSLESYENGGGLEIRASLEIRDSKGGVRIPMEYLGRRLEQWIVKDTSGKIYPVIPVRSDDSSWIVLPGDLPVEVELVPLTSE